MEPPLCEDLISRFTESLKLNACLNYFIGPPIHYAGKCSKQETSRSNIPGTLSALTSSQSCSETKKCNIRSCAERFGFCLTNMVNGVLNPGYPVAV